MGSIFAMVQHLLFMFIGGTGPADIPSGLESTVYVGFFSAIWTFMIAQPILLVGLAVFMLGVVFMVGKKAIGLIRG